MNYIDEFLEYLVVVKKHSDNTIVNYRNDLLEFKEYTSDNLTNVDKDTVFDYLKHLYDEGISKTSIARKLSSLRTFYNYLLKKEIIDINYFSLIKNPKKEGSLPKYVKEDDINKMFTSNSSKIVIDIKGVKNKNELIDYLKVICDSFTDDKSVEEIQDIVENTLMEFK